MLKLNTVPKNAWRTGDTLILSGELYMIVRTRDEHFQLCALEDGGCSIAYDSIDALSNDLLDIATDVIKVDLECTITIGGEKYV